MFPLLLKVFIIHVLLILSWLIFKSFIHCIDDNKESTEISKLEIKLLYIFGILPLFIMVIMMAFIVIPIM